MRHLWVVELLTDDTDVCRWEPTVGVALDREAGRLELAKWRGRNPGSKFRLRKYQPAEDKP